MSQIAAAATFAVFLLVGMLLLLEFGRRCGKIRLAADPQGARDGLSTVDGAIFALLGLLTAFTFSGAASRFDSRRALIVEETNDIGTAWLRLDLLPPEAQPALRDSFRKYVDARLEFYRLMPDITAARGALDRANELQSAIWRQATAATGSGAAASAPMLLLPALNTMFDIASTRAATMQFHPPVIIYATLGLVALISSLLAGFAMAGSRQRSWIHMAGFAMVTAGAVYVILDLEYPRLGFIRVDSFDQLLTDLRQSMN